MVSGEPLLSFCGSRVSIFIVIMVVPERCRQRCTTVKRLRIPCICVHGDVSFDSIRGDIGLCRFVVCAIVAVVSHATEPETSIVCLRGSQTT